MIFCQATPFFGLASFSEFFESSILICMVGAGKDPVSGPEDIRMIHSGKVLEDSRTFEGMPPQTSSRPFMRKRVPAMPAICLIAMPLHPMKLQERFLQQPEVFVRDSVMRLCQCFDPSQDLCAGAPLRNPFSDILKHDLRSIRMPS